LDDAAAATMPIGIMMSIHNQFMDESDDAGAVAAGAFGTVTFFLNDSTLTPVTDGSVGAATPFITLFIPETPKDGKVTPLSKFCVPATDIYYLRGINNDGSILNICCELSCSGCHLCRKRLFISCRNTRPRLCEFCTECRHDCVYDVRLPNLLEVVWESTKLRQIHDAEWIGCSVQLTEHKQFDEHDNDEDPQSDTFVIDMHYI